MHWTVNALEDPGDVQLVQFIDGRLFSILRDRTKMKITFSLGDEFGLIERNPKHQGPFSKEQLLYVLNESGARTVTLGDAQQIRADHRVRLKNAADNAPK